MKRIAFAAFALLFSLPSFAQIGFGGMDTAPKATVQGSLAKGVWQAGRWTVVISRPLARKDGSSLSPKAKNQVCFAVWQGGKREVGSRKSLTMMWTELKLQP